MESIFTGKALIASEGIHAELASVLAFRVNKLRADSEVNQNDLGALERAEVTALQQQVSGLQVQMHITVVVKGLQPVDYLNTELAYCPDAEKLMFLDENFAQGWSVLRNHHKA